MAKSQVRLKAREMRINGLGIKTIAHALKVFSSTVSLWCRDIKLTQEQINELERRSHDPNYGLRLRHTQKQQAVKNKIIQDLFNDGISEVGEITNRELFIAGINLYWAEGFKKDNLVGFSNSDPVMISFFIKWLNECCDIQADRLKFRLGINEQYQADVGNIEKYWQKTLGISKDKFQKVYIQKVKWKKIYDNPSDYHGVLRVRVTKSTNLLRKIHGWIEGIKRNF
jgi:hypothetical protein